MHGEARIRRIAAERLGRRAELLAALHYRARGYRILSRRYRAHGGEIDLIAARPGLVVFVEVKARADFNARLEAGDQATVEQGWQRNYMHGRDLDGSKVPIRHATKRKMKAPARG